MLYQGVMIARASGRLGDSVWSHNRGGPYVRSLGNPNPNPATSEQDAIRNAMRNILLDWQTALSPSQRQAWRDLADDFPTHGRSGILRSIGGWPAFTRANIIRQQTVQASLDPSLTTIIEPPATPVRPFKPEWIETCVAGDGTPNWQIVMADSAPFGEDEGIVVFGGPRLPNAVRFYKSPMTINTVLTNASATSYEGTVAGDFEPGDHVKVKLVACFADGSVSRPYWLDPEIDS